MSYAESVKLAIDTIKNNKDFYIDLLDLTSPARLHLFVTNIGGTDWYNVSAEIFNGSEYKKGVSCSANDLKDFKHSVGQCWVYIQNNLEKMPLSEQIRSASKRAVVSYSTDKTTIKEKSSER